MAENRINPPRLRARFAELDRLTWALVISLALHGAVWGGYEANKKFGWLNYFHLPSWLEKIQQKLTAPQPKKTIEQQRAGEQPLVFVQVNPAVATPEPPKDAKYYSSQNAKAANPDADKDSNIPKFDGSQEQIVRTEDVPRSKAFPLQPSVPQSQTPQEEEKQKRTQLRGDLAMAKPDSVLRKEDGESTKSRPRTIIEAKARQPQSQPLAGQKMKQEGGVKRNLEFSSLDVKATPFGAYDAALIAAVQNSWYGLLDSRNFAGERTGKVALEFHLHPDGRITDMKVLENTVDELLCLLCQRAILEPAPFAKWPIEMRRLIGEDREIKFTFFYN